MNWLQVASAFADTVKGQVVPVVDSMKVSAAVSDSTRQVVPVLEKVISHPLFIALIGVVVGTLLAAWLTKRNQRKQAEQEQQRERQQEEEAESTEESRYLQAVIGQHRFLLIAGLRARSPVEVELERVYVSLAVDSRRLAEIGAEDADRLQRRRLPEAALEDVKRDDGEEISIADALQFIDGNRVCGLVILGGPGTGKTTVMKYLALTYARGLYGERLNQTRPLLPLFVSLRDVAALEEKQPLADYIAGVCNAAGCRVSTGFFDRRLEAGECIVLLDGLDEVADEAEREQAGRWIQTQCEAHAGNLFVVTCRPAGFKETYLPPRFLRLDVQDFEDEDVAWFARNWCLAVETMLLGDSDEARKRGERAGEDLIEAIQTSDRVKALAVNPLLLSIIALVHRYRARLPERRVDLYAECVDVLLGHWDEAKEMKVRIPPGRSLRILQPLALWMHEQKEGEEGERVAHRDEIEPVIAPHLVSIGLRAEDAGGFLDSIRDRSGLLVERGLDIFGFQHQTFQEYLAAREIAEQGNYVLPADHFGEGYWQEVTMLCAGIKDASALVAALLKLPDEKLTEHWRLLMQVLDDALSINGETRKAVFARSLDILKQTDDPDTAVRASLWLRKGRPDVGTLIHAFEAAEGELAKGHFAMLLGETGAERVVNILEPHLVNDNRHVRYLAALALDMLGYKKREVLDDLLMVKVPAGEFRMGSEKGYEDEKPLRTVSTEAFWIDRFPLINAQYRRFIEDGGYRERQHWSEEGWEWKEKEKISEPRYIADPEFGILSSPVVGISWYEAEAYAKWAGKRLLTEQEWERAARGDNDAREYPWGEEFEVGRCNVALGSDQAIFGEAIIGQTSPVGSYPGGVSPYGCYDMSGNVWEWTFSLYKSEENWRVLRGGSWGLPQYSARCSFRFRSHPAYRLNDVGVRFSRTL